MPKGRLFSLSVMRGGGSILNGKIFMFIKEIF